MIPTLLSLASLEHTDAALICVTPSDSNEMARRRGPPVLL